MLVFIIYIAALMELINAASGELTLADEKYKSLFPTEPQQHCKWYNTMRLLNGIGEGSELSNRIPLECNMDELQFVSFVKGCYMGQELTARTKYQVC